MRVNPDAKNIGREKQHRFERDIACCENGQKVEDSVVSDPNQFTSPESTIAAVSTEKSSVVNIMALMHTDIISSNIENFHSRLLAKLNFSQPQILCQSLSVHRSS